VIVYQRPWVAGMSKEQRVIRSGCLALALAIMVLLDASNVGAEWYRGRYEIDSEIAPIDHMSYLLFLPQKSTTTPVAEVGWPLIVSLHGKGQEGEADSLLLLHGLPRLVDANRHFPFAVLAPHLPESLPWDVSQFTPVFELQSELWGDPADPTLPDGLRQALGDHGILPSQDSHIVARDRLKVIYSPAPEGLQITTVFRGDSKLTVSQLQWRAADAVIAILDEVLATFAIDPTRIYLTGLSAGGFGAFDLATVFPHRFAAVAPIAGGGNPEVSPLLQDTPIWAFHGDADRINAPFYTQTMVNALAEIGADVRLTLYPGLGHNVWDLAYADPALYEWFLDHTLESESMTAPAAPADVPSAFSLMQNYPNPFNPTTTIAFDLPSAGHAELNLFNAVGQHVATLIDGLRRAGSYRLRWDGRDDAGRPLAAGQYFYRLTAGPKTETRRLLLLR
jgi:poly(3-hydroxybutyrate) depolymerase